MRHFADNFRFAIRLAADHYQRQFRPALRYRIDRELLDHAPARAGMAFRSDHRLDADVEGAPDRFVKCPAAEIIGRTGSFRQVAHRGEQTGKTLGILRLQSIAGFLSFGSTGFHQRDRLFFESFLG